MNFKPVRALIFLEADYVNGAARTVLNLCDSNEKVQRALGGCAPFLPTVAVFQREPLSSPSTLIEELQHREIDTRIIRERHRFDVRVLRAIRDLIEEIKPDVIQTNSVKSHFLIAALHRPRQSGWIAFHHGYTTPDSKMRMYNQLDRWSLRFAERVVIPCDAFGSELLDRGVKRERLRTVRNAVYEMPEVASFEMELFRKRLDRDLGTNVILSVGRLSSEKGHIHLLQAMARLVRSRPALKLKLLLVGSGPEEHATRAAVRELGLDSVVTLFCHERKIAPFYRMADLFVLPSLREGSPNVIFEAIVSGVPIIATSVGGVPEILKDGETALLVPPKRAEALGSAIAQLLDRPSLGRQLAARATALTRDRFSLEKYGCSVLATYREAMNR